MGKMGKALAKCDGRRCWKVSWCWCPCQGYGRRSRDCLGWVLRKYARQGCGSGFVPVLK